jgi:hypothetical protein
MLTPTQYVHNQVMMYPSLFAAPSYENAAFKVFDHLFNTLGNGINELKEFEVEAQECDKRYFTGEPIYYGYVEAEEIGGKLYPTLGQHAITVLESDLRLHPEIKVWTDIRMTRRNAPYPNFKKEYSMVYSPCFRSVDYKWLDAAVWFYNECLTFFSGDCSSYPYAFPKSTKHDTDLAILNQLEAFGKRSHEEISRDWEFPYNGDIEKFMKGKWQWELERIRGFIIETIGMLKEMYIDCHINNLNRF